MLAAPAQPPLGGISPIESGAPRLSKGRGPKRIIVNADDLGLSRGITDGILLSHLKGIVTSASLMMNQPATEYAVKCLGDDVRTLDVGIHLNLCQGSPVLPPSSVPRWWRWALFATAGDGTKAGVLASRSQRDRSGILRAD